MSIATLKKKTQAKYRNMSVSQPQFSLNGTLRNQGYIGQTSHSRTFVHTPMLGNTVKGHGGKYGEYKQAPIIVEASIFTTNDPTQVKQSVGNHAMDIAVQNRFLSCREWPCSNPVVKKMEYSSETYTEELRKRTLKCEAVNCEEDKIVSKPIAPCCKLEDPGLPKNMFSKTKTNTITKVFTNLNGSIKYGGSYADYLARNNIAFNKKTPLIVNTNRTPNF